MDSACAASASAEGASVAMTCASALHSQRCVQLSRRNRSIAGRYDGIDPPGDSCRLLIIEGLPAGTSAYYELLRASALRGGATISRMLAQRIEQSIGRGARGSGDHCVVLLMGSDLAGWVAKDANFKLLTSATRAQLDMARQ